MDVEGEMTEMQQSPIYRLIIIGRVQVTNSNRTRRTEKSNMEFSRSQFNDLHLCSFLQ